MIRELEFEDGNIRRWAIWNDDHSARLGTDTEDISAATLAEVEQTARIDRLLVELEAVGSATGNMTSAELTTAVRSLARVLAALVRLYLRRL